MLKKHYNLLLVKFQVDISEGVNLKFVNSIHIKEITHWKITL